MKNKTETTTENLATAEEKTKGQEEKEEQKYLEDMLSIHQYAVRNPGLKQHLEVEEKLKELDSEYVEKFGQVVWSRCSKDDPWWPSVVYSPMELKSSIFKTYAKRLGSTYFVCFYNSGAGGWINPKFGIMSWEEGLKAGFDKKNKSNEKEFEKIEAAVSEAKADLAVKPQMRFRLNHPQIDESESDVVSWAYARYAVVDESIQGQDMCGHCVSIFWSTDSVFYTGIIDSYDETTKKHKIIYEDGDEESLEMSNQVFHFWRRSPDFARIAAENKKNKKKVEKKKKKAEEKSEVEEKDNDVKDKIDVVEDEDSGESSYEEVEVEVEEEIEVEVTDDEEEEEEVKKEEEEEYVEENENDDEDYVEEIKKKKKKRLKKKVNNNTKNEKKRKLSNEKQEQQDEPAKKKKKRTYDKVSMKQKTNESTQKYVKRMCMCLNHVMEYDDDLSVKSGQRALRYMYVLTSKDQGMVKPKINLDFLMKSKSVEVVKKAKKSAASKLIREAAKTLWNKWKELFASSSSSKKKKKEEKKNKTDDDDDGQTNNNNNVKTQKPKEEKIEKIPERDHSTRRAFLHGLIKSIGDNVSIGDQVETLVWNQFGEKDISGYKRKLRVLCMNLTRNQTLQDHLKSGIVTPQKLINMSPEELQNPEKRALNKKLDAEYRHKQGLEQVDNLGEATTDMFKCENCGSRKTTFYQKQTRSADEPMTTFVTCVECGKKWRNDDH